MINVQADTKVWGPHADPTSGNRAQGVSLDDGPIIRTLRNTMPFSADTPVEFHATFEPRKFVCIMLVKT